MADTLNPVGNVYEGFWIDWSKGTKWGLTWTPSPLAAMVFTNMLALFVTLSGAHLWTPARYVFHQLGSLDQTGLSSQHLIEQQRILRNASHALTTAHLMLKLAWSSRQNFGVWSFLGSYSIGLIAVIYAVCFMAAEIFSNYVISAGSINGASPVLWRTEQCGVWNATYLQAAQCDAATEEDFDLFVQYTGKQVHDVQLSFEYAQECYQANTAADYVSCNTLKVPELAWDVHEGSCPFQSQICHKDSEVIVLETGYIDSDNELGINSIPEDRLKYRRVTTCALLNDTGRILGGALPPIDSLEPKISIAYADYGPSLRHGTNWTYSYSNSALFSGNVMLPYQLDAEEAWAAGDPAWNVDDFDPIPELAQEEADLVLLFLSFTGLYLAEVDDPWFAAHDVKHLESQTPFLRTLYAPDVSINTLGCTEVHQFCTASDICTGLLGLNQLQNVASFDNALTPHQNATFDRMLRAVSASSLGYIIKNLALTTASILASNQTIIDDKGSTLSAPLPDNQWKSELNYWHTIAMAQFQRTIAQWATGQIAVEPQYLDRPTEEQDIWFCKSLMVPSLAYQSFCVLAIILIVTLGVLVIIASVTIQLRGLDPKTLEKVDSAKSLMP